MLIFFKLVTLALNIPIPVSISLVEAPLKLVSIWREAILLYFF